MRAMMGGGSGSSRAAIDAALARADQATGASSGSGRLTSRSAHGGELPTHRTAASLGMRIRRRTKKKSDCAMALRSMGLRSGARVMLFLTVLGAHTARRLLAPLWWCKQL